MGVQERLISPAVPVPTAVLPWTQFITELSLRSAPAHPECGGFQFLDLSTPTPTFGSVFASQAPTGSFANISEDVLVDPNRNLLLSPSELNNYEIINLTGATPAFFENGSIGTGGALDSAAEDCSTGIILAPAEFLSPSLVYIADFNASHVFRWLTRNMDCTLICYKCCRSPFFPRERAGSPWRKGLISAS